MFKILVSYLNIVWTLCTEYNKHCVRDMFYWQWIVLASEWWWCLQAKLILVWFRLWHAVDTWFRPRLGEDWICDCAADSININMILSKNYCLKIIFNWFCLFSLLTKSYMQKTTLICSNGAKGFSGFKPWIERFSATTGHLYCTDHVFDDIYVLFEFAQSLSMKITQPSS